MTTEPTVPTVPTSFMSGNHYMSQADQKWNSELATLNTIPNAFAQLLYIMFVMMPTKEQEISGKMEYQDYLMDQVSDQLMPRLDSIKDDFNEVINEGLETNFSTQEPQPGPGQDALSQANWILQLLYTNPNLSSNSQLLNNVTSALEGVFVTPTMDNPATENEFRVVLVSSEFSVNVDGNEETVSCPQFQPQELSSTSTQWKPDDTPDQGGMILDNYWTGFNLAEGASGGGAALSPYESQLAGRENAATARQCFTFRRRPSESPTRAMNHGP